MTWCRQNERQGHVSDAGLRLTELTGAFEVEKWPKPHQLIVVDDDTVLRPVFEVSTDDLYRLIDQNRTYLGRYLDFATPEYSLEDAETYARISRENWGRTGEQSYVIIHADNVAGTIGMHRYGVRNRAVEIGYWLDSGLQGRGIMTRCVQKMTEMAFEHLGVNQVNISADVANNPSRAIAERSGFQSDGITRQWLVNATGELADMVRYSILRDEWKGSGK